MDERYVPRYTRAYQLYSQLTVLSLQTTVNERQLQDILLQKIDEGFTFRKAACHKPNYCCTSVTHTLTLTFFLTCYNHHSPESKGKILCMKIQVLLISKMKTYPVCLDSSGCYVIPDGKKSTTNCWPAECQMYKMH